MSNKTPGQRAHVMKLAPAKRRDTPPSGIDLDGLNARELALFVANTALQTSDAIGELSRKVASVEEALTTLTDVVRHLANNDAKLSQAITLLTTTVNGHGEELFRRLGLEAGQATLAARLSELESTVKAMPTPQEIKTAIATSAQEARGSSTKGAMVGGAIVTGLAELGKAVFGGG